MTLGDLQKFFIQKGLMSKLTSNPQRCQSNGTMNLQKITTVVHGPPLKDPGNKAETGQSNPLLVGEFSGRNTGEGVC